MLVYGIIPAIKEGTPRPALGPALTLRTFVAQIRRLPAGHSVSYGRTCTLSRSTRIATIPVGYGDGYPRALSNCGSVLIGGKRAPILGRICMDVTLVDVTDLPDAELGAEVVLIGSQGDERISVEEIARLTDATEHDVTLRLTERVRKIYKNVKHNGG